MATNGLPPTDRDRLRLLEQRIDALEKATRLQSASIGQGGLRVYDGGSITVTEPGDLVLVDEQANVTWRASESPTVIRTKLAAEYQQSLPTLDAKHYGDPPSDVTLVPVPAGYLGAYFVWTAACQTTMNDPGSNFALYPSVWCDNAQVYDPNVAFHSSDSVAAFKNAVCSATWAGSVDLTGCTDFRFALTISVGSGTVPNTTYWQVGGLVVFTRTVPPDALPVPA